MRHWAVASLMVLGLALVGGAIDAGGNKGAQPTSISYHGNSFYILTTSKGTRIAFDPHMIPEYPRVTGLKADLILISHNHNDHTRVEALENGAKAKIIRGLKSESVKADWSFVDETFKDVKIRTVGVYHDDAEGLQRGKNAVFIVEADGWRFVHLGD